MFFGNLTINNTLTIDHLICNNDSIPVDCVTPISPMDLYCAPGDVFGANCLDLSNAMCSMATIGPTCLPPLNISGTSCTSPISPTCLPPLSPSFLQCSPSNKFNSSCLNLSGATCSYSVDASCIPTTLANETITDTLTINNLVCNTSNPIEGLCVNISGQTCASPVDPSCIPTTLANETITDTLTINNLVCNTSNPIQGSCLNISGQTCSSPVDMSCLPPLAPSDIQCSPSDVFNASCLDLTNATCPSGPVDVSCLPDTVGNWTVTDTLTINKLECTSNFIPNSCLNLTDYINVTDITCSTPLDASCIPTSAENFTVTDTLTINRLECTSNFIPNSCLNLTDYINVTDITCSTPLDASCIPTSADNFTVTDTLTINNLVCAGHFIPNSCLNLTDSINVTDITCSSPLDMSCINISGALCTVPIDLSCLPATPFDVPFTLVERDASGNFAASQINATDLMLTGTQANATVLESLVVNDTYDRFSMTADGTMSWGNGSSPEDVNMFRTGPNTLLVDYGNLLVSGYLAAGFSAAPPNTFPGAFSASTYFSANLNTTSVAIDLRVLGDTMPRSQFLNDGSHLFGDGTNPPDVRFHRFNANIITIDNGTSLGPAALHVAGAVNGRSYISAGPTFGAPLNTNPGDISGKRFFARGDNTTEIALGVGVIGDAYDRFDLQPDGTMNWGTGAAPADVNLARYTNATLQETGNLLVSGYLALGQGWQGFWPTGNATPPNTFPGAFTATTYFSWADPNNTIALSFRWDPDQDGEPDSDNQYDWYQVWTDGQELWGGGVGPMDVRFYRPSASVLSLDNGTTLGPATLQVTQNVKVGGYIVANSTTFGQPQNHQPGDITGSRLMIGTDTAFGNGQGLFAIINGNDLTSGTGNGIYMIPTWSPPANTGNTFTGVNIDTALGSNSNITGGLVGAEIGTFFSTAGSVNTLVGLFVNNQLTGSLASNFGLLTLNLTSAGSNFTSQTFYLVMDGTGSGAQIKIITVNASDGSILTFSINHPGVNYTVGDMLTLVPVNNGTNATFTVTSVAATIFGSGSGGQIVGVQSQAFTAAGTFNTPQLGKLVAFQALASNLGSGPASRGTSSIGLEVQNLNSGAANTGVLIDVMNTGGATTNTGIMINSPTGSSTANVGLQITTPTSGTTNYALQFSTQSTTEAGGILFGSGADSPHANMYRSAAGRTRTDGELQALHYLCVSGTPTFTAAAGAGTSPTITVTGTDAGMQVSLTTGTGPTAANIFLINYASTYSSASTFPVFSPANAAAAALSGVTHPYISAQSTTSFTFHAGTTALAASTTYVWNFSVRA
jgi:hypothetical protein